MGGLRDAKALPNRIGPQRCKVKSLAHKRGKERIFSPKRIDHPDDGGSFLGAAH